MVATRAAVDRCSPGNGDAPLVWQGAHRGRHSTEPEACHQGRGGGGVRAALRPTGTEDSPPGERPAPLSEVAGPQRSDRTVRHSAGEAPLLVVPSLRGADGVDGTTVSFLLAENLKLKKEEGEKERRREGEEAEYEAHMQELDRRAHADLRSLLPNLAHGGSGPATTPYRRGERKRGRRKNFLGVLVLDKVVDVPVFINDKFQQFVFQL